MANSETIRQIIASAGSHFVSVSFTKKDGTERQMTFNPFHIGEIKGTGAPMVNPDAIQNIVRVMDSQKGWRSFDCRRVFRVKVNGVTTELQPEI
jgi:hypothetical protein